MVRKDKLLARIRNNPDDVRFSDFVAVVEAVGFDFVRQRGSHRMYRHRRTHDPLNLQPRRDGKAKDWQVRFFLDLLDERGLDIEEDKP
jgi:hypothetical protein